MTNSLSQFIQLDTIKIDNKNNAFDFVRLILALFVVFTHSRYLFGADDILHWQAKYFDNLHAGTIALLGFLQFRGI
jgi:peptidoglycan/LPS O-acetylase OafA/YrhL